MATETYRSEQITEATEKLDAARTARAAAKTRAARRIADEDIEFWGNKLAYLVNIRG